MLAGPGEEHPLGFSTFGSADEFEQYLLDKSIDQWEYLFGQSVCRDPRTGWFANARLQAGDADQDLDFDQLDLVQVQIAAKYLTRQPATWGQGDWNGAPGGCPGYPPKGDGVFNQLDIVAALTAGRYLMAYYSGPDGGYSPPDHSQTNVQVEGVDEGDIVETDGNYIYVVSDRQLVIADAWPADQLNVAARVDLPGDGFAEYLVGDRLAVLSQSVREFGPTNRPRAGINVTVLDVSDAQSPRVVQETAVEGTYIDSRAIGDTLFLVTSDRVGQFQLPPPEVRCASAQDPICHYETRDQYRERVKGHTHELGLPYLVATDGDGQVVRKEPISQATRVYRPLSPQHSVLLSVVTIDVGSDRLGPIDSTTVPTTAASDVYASTDSLYVINPEGDSTSLVRFDLDADVGQVNLSAVGKIPGRVLNTFSMDEHDGYLRIATASGWGQTTQNRVLVAKPVDGQLEIVGQTGSLAPGEEIHSVRFFEDRGYVVTFPPPRPQPSAQPDPPNPPLRDPLFPLDLSDPRNPRVVGELEIRGFSNYLHPVGDDFLIGLGRDADEQTGEAQQLQVSLFDVSDPIRPLLAERFDFDLPNWASTEAIGDHHAIAYYPQQQVLAIPVTNGGTLARIDRNGDGWVDIENNLPRTDLWVLRIDPAASSDGDEATRAIQLVGRIQQNSDVRRSVRIEELLYTLSDTSIAVHDLRDPDQPLNQLRYSQMQVGFPLFLADRQAPSVRQAIENPADAAPQVVGLAVGSTQWRARFRDHLQSLGTNGDLPTTTSAVPFTGIDQIQITFSENVLVGPDDLRIRENNRSARFFSEFQYDPETFTAVWTLSVPPWIRSAPLEANALSLELTRVTDVDSNQLASDAAGHANGQFRHQFDLLAGDLNGDGRVGLADTTLVREHFGRIGDAAYRVSADIDGNGLIDDGDLMAIERRLGETLSASPAALPGDSNLDGRFDQLDIVRVLIFAKYLAGEPATWAEGDWNGDGWFNQLDIVAALQAGHYTHNSAAATAAT